MPFFAKKKSDGSIEPVPSVPEGLDDQDLVSVTRRRDAALKRLGELQFKANSRGALDQDAYARCLSEIQWLDDQLKLIADRRQQDRAPIGLATETCTCGAPLTSDDLFCRTCGSRRAAGGGTATFSQGTGTYCNVCQQRLKPGSVFCAFCGARVVSPPSGHPVTDGPPSRQFGFQMSSPLPQNGMRDAGLGDWHEGQGPAHAFAASGPHMPAPNLASPPNPQIRNQWGRHLEEIVNPTVSDPTVYLRRGVSLARDNQLIEATEQFEQASKLAPRDPMPRYHLGLVRYRMGDLDGAIGEFERALRINPNFPDAHNDLGLVLTKKGQVREAIHHFRKSLQIQPQHPDAHYNLGYACLAMGDPVGAVSHLDMYLRIAPNAPDARAVGEMLMKLRQQQKP